MNHRGKGKDDAWSVKSERWGNDVQQTQGRFQKRMRGFVLVLKVLRCCVVGRQVNSLDSCSATNCYTEKGIKMQLHKDHEQSP